MSTFSVFQDSPTRQTSSSFTFRSKITLRLNEVAATPNHDKENVDPITCLGPTTANLKGKKAKRKYIRQDGAGPLAAKKKLKVSFAVDAMSPVKKGDKKRRTHGGGSRLLAPRPLARQDTTIILDGLTDFANRRAIELTVSPLADASEAYLSVPGSAPQSPSPFVELTVPLETTASLASIESASSSDFFGASQASASSTPTQRSLSPLVLEGSSHEAYPASGRVSPITDALADMLCLQIPLPASP